MLRRRTVQGRKNERGIVILLVAIVLLFVIAAIAALAIDLVTFYTARSEAQLAADGAALAGARVLANSGMTSDPNASSDGLMANAETLATLIATQVASGNQVGGRNLSSTGTCVPGSEISVCFNDTDPSFVTNPRVTVQVQRSDLPTFFARIWGRGAVTVHATATAEAYNPSGLNTTPGVAPPVAPTCVKPWVLPNISPTDGTTPIFNPATGAIQDPALLGWEDPATPATFYARCSGGGCTPWSGQTPSKWQYYPGALGSFPAPTQALPACGFALNAYQESIAGCVQIPIACNSTVDLDQATHFGRNAQTVAAANCMTHSTANGGDVVTDNPALTPGQPFQFRAGDDNPVADARGTDVLVSSSLVTVPVYNSIPGTAPANPVTIIGFVQLFLNPDGLPASTAPNRIRTTVVNLVGCGTNATTPPILGNGASAVPVRLITAP